jgi:hypothetical protein
MVTHHHLPVLQLMEISKTVPVPGISPIQYNYFLQNHDLQIEVIRQVRNNLRII